MINMTHVRSARNVISAGYCSRKDAEGYEQSIIECADCPMIIYRTDAPNECKAFNGPPLYKLVYANSDKIVEAMKEYIASLPHDELMEVLL